MLPSVLVVGLFHRVSPLTPPPQGELIEAPHLSSGIETHLTTTVYTESFVPCIEKEMHIVLHPPHLVITAAQMRAAERRAMLDGITGWEMMHAAGMRAAAEMTARFRPRRTLVLCGPGNNGGDGFVIAEALRLAGWPVEVACMITPSALRGDAKTAAEAYRGEIVPFNAEIIRPELLLVDALFGTGLERPLEGEARHVLSMADTLECTVVAVDIPSGIHPDTAKVLGSAAHAALTVTFAARRPAHLLYPGREYCGEVAVADIGIARQVEAVVAERKTDARVIHENHPELWEYSLRWPRPHTHKYMRGSAVVAGGGIAETGATRLAALSALRVGAGVVTVCCGKEALPVYAARLTSVMTRVTETAEEYAACIADARHRALLVGPGHSVGERTAEYVLAALSTAKACVLDADALTSFAGRPETLFAAITGEAVLTPHEREFSLLFPDLEGDKITRAREAATRSKVVVLLKGADTVIACPDGRAVVNTILAPDLATAGSGDVLAGIITGLLATGIPAFEAACAGAWIHSAAGEKFGAGLIAEDVPQMIPEVLKYLRGRNPLT